MLHDTQILRSSTSTHALTLVLMKLRARHGRKAELFHDIRTSCRCLVRKMILICEPQPSGCPTRTLRAPTALQYRRPQKAFTVDNVESADSGTSRSANVEKRRRGDSTSEPSSSK